MLKQQHAQMLGGGHHGGDHGGRDLRGGELDFRAQEVLNTIKRKEHDLEAAGLVGWPKIPTHTHTHSLSLSLSHVHTHSLGLVGWPKIVAFLFAFPKRISQHEIAV
jgi:hypothetical protein